MHIAQRGMPPAGGRKHLHYLPQTGVYHVPFCETYLSGSMHTLAIGKLPAMTTFPSFHTATGMLLIYGCRTNPATLVIAAV